jgi:hypothetical protein
MSKQKRGPLSINAVFSSKMSKNAIYTEGSPFLFLVRNLVNYCRSALVFKFFRLKTHLY